MLHDFLNQAKALKQEYENISSSKKISNLIAKPMIKKEMARLLSFIKSWPPDQISYKDIIEYAKFIYHTEDNLNIDNLINFDIYGYIVNIQGSKCIIRIRYKQDPTAWVFITADLYSNIIIVENEYDPVNGYRKESVGKLTEILISEIFIRFIYGYITIYLEYK